MIEDYKEKYEEQISECFAQLILIAFLSFFCCVGFVTVFFLTSTVSVIDLIFWFVTGAFVFMSCFVCVNSIIELVGMWKEEKETIRKEMKK